MSDKQKKAISKILKEKWKDPDYRRKMAKAVSKSWENKHRRKKHTKAMVKHWENDSYRLKTSTKISDGKLRAYANGSNKVTVVSTGKYMHTHKSGIIICHDASEAMFASMLDYFKYVESFVKDSFRIPYEWKDKRHTYFPDFKITMTNGCEIVVELKTHGIHHQRRDPVKFETAMEFCRNKGIRFVIIELTGHFSDLNILRDYLRAWRK